MNLKEAAAFKKWWDQFSKELDVFERTLAKQIAWAAWSERAKQEER